MLRCAIFHRVAESIFDPVHLLWETCHRVICKVNDLLAISRIHCRRRRFIVCRRSRFNNRRVQWGRTWKRRRTWFSSNPRKITVWACNIAPCYSNLRLMSIRALEHIFTYLSWLWRNGLSSSGKLCELINWSGVSW